jgi:hypothetical protein
VPGSGGLGSRSCVGVFDARGLVYVVVHNNDDCWEGRRRAQD